MGMAIRWQMKTVKPMAKGASTCGAAANRSSVTTGRRKAGIVSGHVTVQSADMAIAIDAVDNESTLDVHQHHQVWSIRLLCLPLSVQVVRHVSPACSLAGAPPRRIAAYHWLQTPRRPGPASEQGVASQHIRYQANILGNSSSCKFMHIVSLSLRGLRSCLSVNAVRSSSLASKPSARTSHFSSVCTRPQEFILMLCFCTEA